MFKFLNKSQNQNKVKSSLPFNSYMPYKESHIFYEEYHLRPNSYEDFLEFYKDDIL